MAGQVLHVFERHTRSARPTRIADAAQVDDSVRKLDLVRTRQTHYGFARGTHIRRRIRIGYHRRRRISALARAVANQMPKDAPLNAYTTVRYSGSACSAPITAMMRAAAVHTLPTDWSKSFARKL